ncbi:MAG: VOC family protein [Culicoidibacterales bacterium]
MLKLNVYLNFAGNCREAVEYYSEVFGVPAKIMTFGEAPAKEGMEMPEEMKSRIMHAQLVLGNNEVMFSDTMPGMEFIVGNNISLSINGTDHAEMTKWFQALAADGTVQMPLAPTFWGPMYGMLVDRFGICWQFNLATA